MKRLALASSIIALTAMHAAEPAKLAAETGYEVSWRPSVPSATDGAGSSDLTLDGSFNGGSGTAFVDNPTSGGSNDQALTVMDAGDGRYWLVGSSSADDGTHATPVVTEFSADGTAGAPAFYASNTTLSSLSSIAAAVEGVNNGTRRIYVTGVYHYPNATDDDFGVLCLDPANAFLGCAGFGSNGFRAFHFDHGGTNNDVPTSIAYDDLSGDVYVAGYIDTGSGNAVAVVRFNGTTGVPDADWGNAAATDGSFVYPIHWTTNGSSYAIAVTAGAPQAFVHDVFVAGTADANSSGTDTDGFVLPIDAVNGSGLDPAWHGGSPLRIYFDLGATIKTDSIRALALRHNGDLLVAGDANGDSGLSHLILGEYDPTGNARADFCFGAGICQGPLNAQPVVQALAERPGAGDIVISASNLVSGIPVQGVYQIDAQGQTMIASNAIDWTSQNGSDTSFSRGLLIDAANRVLLAGTRVWNASTHDDDMTVGRFAADDSIFGNGFGGRYAD